MDNTKIHPKDIQEDDRELCFFIYNNKYEYTKRRNEMFDEIKDSIIITDSAYKLIIYSGIYDLYKVKYVRKILENKYIHEKGIKNIIIQFLIDI